MKQKRYITIFVTILILFCVIMTYVRFSNNQETQAQIYQDWQRIYLRKKGEQAFVDTTPQATKPVVLSEDKVTGC
ncbi:MULTISPECIES: hypothetical protein [Lactobacillus]|uniref:hypothetical protein n=1 Tax=Lactobacillus TaxID=1578 RepID=UPI001F48D133|nr:MULTISPECIES: hypothetical protein [Lactobacillus]